MRNNTGLYTVVTACLVVGLFVSSIAGCGKKGNPVIPGSIAPEPVSSLKAHPAQGKVSLTWTMPEKTTEGKRLLDLESFLVQRGEVPKGTSPVDCSCVYETVAAIDADAPAPARIEGTKVFFDDTTVKNDRTYAYRVIAVNRYERESKPAGPVIARPSIPPAAPSNLAAQPDENMVRLSWSAPSTSEDGSSLTDLTGYNLYRGMQTGTHTTLINPEPVKGTSYADMGLENGRKYYYVVRAVDSPTPPYNESKPSEEVVVAPEDRTPPAPPAGLIAVAGTKDIRLTWEPGGEKDLSGYRIYRSTSPGQGYQPVTASQVKTNSYTDTDVTPGTMYFYIVTAVDNSPRANESFRSEQVTVVVSVP